MTQSISFHDLRDTAEIPEALLARTEADLSDFLDKVDPIIAAVRDEGDAALIRFGRAFDKVEPETFSIAAEPEEFEAAFDAVEPEVIDAIRYAAGNIRRFHEAQKPEEMWWKEMQPGVYAGDRHVPIDAVACYVPRGKGSFPSVLMMTAIPALVAGVPKPIVITPPGPDGRVDAATLVAAKLIGIEHVYKCGGAQGVAAVAYGTQSVPRCDKIVGPGSPWVVAAKRRLSDRLEPGTPAGPSECVILADDSADGALAALDLIIESEHGPDSSAYLVTSSERVAAEAREALPRHWAEMVSQRAEFSRTVLGGQHGGIVLTRDFDAAIDFVNAYAPEHLEVLAEEPMAVLGRITNAGEVLLGNYTPVTIGNFVLGPNAVLPTNRMAKVASPLSVHDYMKRISVGYVTRSGYDQLAGPAETLARYEGFDGHARAVSSLRRSLLDRKAE
ncbi:histidinol dehydrogenase [Salinicola rhizosphaerae]|uniref:Histidinol dehydrogenase n=1 Tax=Salinicola rhizosphaerae TaxID=1443141 RepID=A0ABQ3DWA9_9GAMM|nr:histidinol dehydrogenase [Salinicola rhizosphaerae]GHB18303.1 histidinol dehydrogenase [Salinicola rhizosphaerae]